MSLSPCPAPYVICWQQQTVGDESTLQQRAFANLVEAELALECLHLDHASADIRCSWLDPQLLAELEVIPF